MSKQERAIKCHNKHSTQVDLNPFQNSKHQDEIEGLKNLENSFLMNNLADSKRCDAISGGTEHCKRDSKNIHMGTALCSISRKVC